MTAPSLDRLAGNALLADGTTVALRPIGPDDEEALATFHDGLSPDSVYKRFFNAHPHLTATEVARFTHVDYDRRLALVAELDGQLVGVGRYDREENGDRAEVAFVVADRMQGLGLGTLLLEHLAAAARHRGITGFWASTLLTNEQMQDVFRRAGFASHSRFDDGLVQVAFPITPDETYLESLLGRLGSSTRARLGLDPAASPSAWVVCGSEPVALEYSRAFAGAGREVGTVVTEDVPAGLAAVALAPASPVARVGSAAVAGVGSEPAPVAGVGSAAAAARPVVVELGAECSPRRFVAVARAAARQARVVAVAARGSERWRQVCEQAGVELVGSPADAIALISAVDGFGPAAGGRGAVAAVEGCDPAAARRVLDATRSAAPPGSGWLEPEAAAAVVAAYGIGTSPGPGLVARDCGEGLEIVTSRASGDPVRRWVPLTEVDAIDLAGEHAEVALRLSRLVDDMDDIAEVVVPAAGAGGSHIERMGMRVRVQVRCGAERGSADDPWVRRLP